MMVFVLLLMRWVIVIVGICCEELLVCYWLCGGRFWLMVVVVKVRVGISSVCVMLVVGWGRLVWWVVGSFIDVFLVL